MSGMWQKEEKGEGLREGEGRATEKFLSGAHGGGYSCARSEEMQ